MKSKSIEKYVVPAIVVIALVLVLVFTFGGRGMNVESSESDAIIENTDKGEIKLTADGTKYIVDPNKIRGGGPPKGGIGFDRGIPALALENIKFVSVEEADEWIQDDELVLALEKDGEKRVYPLQIMTWHEIANDEINGEPILVTYCPLCGSGIAYERTIELNGKREETRFGTSGKLFNSNLIMYDELTDTYWQQIDGLAIVGALTGQELREISLDTVTWSEWKAVHPDSKVLSQDTGINRNYGRNPYANYFENDFQFYFDVENRDDTGRIQNKEFVFGIEIDGNFKAYREIDVKEKGIIEDNFAGVDLKIERMEDGRVIITRSDTGEEIVKEVDFWFAWYTFHPETELYGF